MAGGRGAKGGGRGRGSSKSKGPAGRGTSGSLQPQPNNQPGGPPTAPSQPPPTPRPALELKADFEAVALTQSGSEPEGEQSAITPTTGSGKGRRRQSSKAAKKPHELAQKTAKLPDQLTRHYLFTAIVDAAVLNPFWGTGHAANRPLNQPHVDSLVATFATNTIHRFNKDHRMYASIPRKEADKLIETCPDIKKGDALTSSSRTLFVIKNEVWKTLGVRPTLEAGQHRRAAILAMNDLPVSAKEGVCNMPTDANPDVQVSYPPYQPCAADFML